MTPEDQQKLEEYCQGIAAILYRNAEAKNAEQLKTLEGIELAVREQMLENVSPKIGIFCRNKQWHNSRKRETSEELYWQINNYQQASKTTKSKSKNPT